MSGSSWPGENELNEIKNTGPTMVGRGPEEVRVVLSPHRICPLGAHIDHQGGTVSAMTINEGMLLGFNPSVDTDVKGGYVYAEEEFLSGQTLIVLATRFYRLVLSNNLLRRLTSGRSSKKLEDTGGLLSSVWRSFQSVRVYLTGWSLMPAGFRNGWKPLKHLHHVYEILLKARGVFGTRLISAGSRGYPAFADANLVEEAVTFVTEEYRCLSNLLTKTRFDM